MVAYTLTLHAQQGLLRWTKSSSILLLENHSDSLINVCAYFRCWPLFPGEQDRPRAMWHAKPRQHNGDRNQNLLRPDCMRQDGPNIFLETLKTQRVMHKHLQTVAHMVNGLITFTHLLWVTAENVKDPVAVGLFPISTNSPSLQILGSTTVQHMLKCSIEPFVALEEATSNLTNYLQCCHSVAKLHCG